MVVRHLSVIADVSGLIMIIMSITGETKMSRFESWRKEAQAKDVRIEFPSQGTTSFEQAKAAHPSELGHAFTEEEIEQAFFWMEG